MLATLIAVRDELQADARLDYVRDADIAIVPSDLHLPGLGPKFPCIAVKDGKIVRRKLAGGGVEWRMDVQVMVYTALQKDQERSVIGDASSGQPGILRLALDVCSVLDDNLLGMAPLIQEAEITAEEESGVYARDETSAIQRKKITITYTKETEGSCGH